MIALFPKNVKAHLTEIPDGCIMSKTGRALHGMCSVGFCSVLFYIANGQEDKTMGEELRELTFTDKQKLEAELADLMEAKKRVAEEIKVARGFGDLSENAEYTEAKAEEGRVYGRIMDIEKILQTAVFVDDSKVDTDTVSVGTAVRVFDMEYEEEDEYTIVGFTEADPLKLYISSETPIGMALIGARVGDVVSAQTPGGSIKLKVLEIKRR